MRNDSTIFSDWCDCDTVRDDCDQTRPLLC
jgi:hypothetical protein